MKTSSAKVQIRLARAADTDAIIDVVNAAFSLPLEQVLEGTRTDAVRMAKLQATGQFHVAEDAGRVIAAVYTELRGERGYIGMLAVDPARQGAGLGRAMMQVAEDHLRQHGCNVADLTVLSLRPELPPVYRRFGYVEIGTDEFHPSRPLKPGVECHCIKMAKPL